MFDIEQKILATNKGLFTQLGKSVLSKKLDGNNYLIEIKTCLGHVSLLTFRYDSGYYLHFISEKKT